MTPVFAALIRGWRGSKPFSYATRALQQRGHDVTEATLRWWEYGYVGNPDRAILKALIEDVYKTGSLAEAEAALAQDIAALPVRQQIRLTGEESSVSQNSAPIPQIVEVTGGTVPVTLPRQTSRIGEAEARAKREAGLIVEHWGFAERLLRGVPEDRREEAYAAAVAAISKAITSFTAGVVTKGPHVARRRARRA